MSKKNPLGKPVGHIAVDFLRFTQEHRVPARHAARHKIPIRHPL